MESCSLSSHCDSVFFLGVGGSPKIMAVEDTGKASKLLAAASKGRTALWKEGEVSTLNLIRHSHDDKSSSIGMSAMAM